MKTSLSLLLVPLAILGASHSALAQNSHLFNPAEHKATSAVVRNEDDTAWFGEYASNPQQYDPLFLEDLSQVRGDPIIVWARLRGYAVQTKAVATDGNQTELTWTWDNPKDWKWIKLGSYSRTQIGQKLLIIRGPDATANAGLNAVLLTSDAQLDPTGLSQKDLEARAGRSGPDASASPAQ